MKDIEQPDMTEIPPPEKPNKPAPRTYSAWMGFATREITDQNLVRIKPRWGRIIGFLALLAVGMWTVKTVGLYYFFKEVRDFEEVSFVDMIFFPMNRSSVRVNQGDYQIERAKAALQREDYRRAFALLREGLARSPANTEGRMLLARIYAGWRPDLATSLMSEGIEYGKEDPEYVKMTCMLLLQEKQDARLLEMTKRLREEDLPEEVQQILTVTRFQAAFLRGDFETVRNLIETTDIERSLDGVIMGTQLYQRTGRAQEAVAVLRSALRNIDPENAAPVINQLISVYKSTGNFDRARELSLNKVILNPMDWRPRIQLIDILSASDQHARRDREIEALLKEHRNDEQAMISLAQLCAEYGNVEAASRLYEIALENGFSLSLFSLTLAEAMVQDGQFQAAIDLCNELVEEDPAWMLTAEASFNAIRSLAYYGSGDPELGSLYLKNFLTSKRSNSTQLLEAARRFRKNGLDEQARLILEEAYARDPLNEQALVSLIRVEMDLGVIFNLYDHLQALFDLRRPNYQTLEEIHDDLRSDRFLFTRDRQELLEELAKIISEQEKMDWDIWGRRTAGQAS